MGNVFVIIGSIGAALSGLVGQLTNFRFNGVVTRRAKWVLLGVGLSTAVTLIGGWLAHRDDAETTRITQAELKKAVWEQGNHLDANDIKVQVVYRFDGELMTG